MGFSCVSPSTSAGRARGTSEQTSEQGLVLAVTKWLISSIQELKNLPKQKSRPRRSNYTWGGGGRGEEEKKTSITEPLPHETQRGLGGTWRRRGLSRAGCKHTPDPCPHLAIPVGEHWPVLSPWAPANVENLLRKTFCASAIEFQWWDQLELLSPAGSPHPGKVVVLHFLSQLESLGRGTDLWTCPAHLPLPQVWETPKYVKSKGLKATQSK